MAVKTFTRPYDYDPSVTKEVVVAEPHTIPASAPYSVYLRHIPRQQTPSTVVISGASTTWTEVATPPSASGEYRVRYDEALGRIEFHSSDAGKSITVNYNACGTVIWAEDYADGRPNTAELQEVLERVQEASGIDYSSAVSGFSSSDVKAALDALAAVRIVERGSNSNGEYVRWENGLQVCWGRWAAANDAQLKTTSFPFPAAFVSKPIVATTASTDTSGQPDANLRIAGANYPDTTPTSLALYYSRVSGTQYGGHVQWLAVGRWK